MILVLLFDRDARLVDTACSRRYHASIKSRQTSPTGDERQNKRKSGPSPADSLNESQLAARSGTSPPRRTSPTSPMKTASLVAIARLRALRRRPALPLIVQLSSERPLARAHVTAAPVDKELSGPARCSSSRGGPWRCAAEFGSALA